MTIKSAYLSISWADLSSGTSTELSGTPRVDSNTSLSVWSNFYLLGLVCVFLCDGASVDISVGRWSLPRSSPIWNWMSCLVRFCELNAMSRMSVLPQLCPNGYVRHYLNKQDLIVFGYFWTLDQCFFCWHSRNVLTQNLNRRQAQNRQKDCWFEITWGLDFH